MKKSLLLLLSCFFITPVMANIENSVQYIDTDAFGNDLYIADDEFIFVDGSKRHGQFVSVSLSTMAKTRQAGYAIIPANNLQEMSDNAHLAEVFTVDCAKKQVIDSKNHRYQLNDLNELHILTAEITCDMLKD